MKKLLIPILIAASIFTFSAADAQVRVNLNVNIGSQPAWGPTGYDHVDYYYMPDYDLYYSVPEQAYYYKEGNSWRHTAALPARFKNADIYKAHKVVINKVDRPYLNNTTYQKKYASFKGKHDQAPIRDSRDEKYFESKYHPQHQAWEQKQANNKNNKDNNKNNNKNDNKNDRNNNNRRNR